LNCILCWLVGGCHSFKKGTQRYLAETVMLSVNGSPTTLFPKTYPGESFFLEKILSV